MFVSWNDWNVLHVPWPCIIAPYQNDIIYNSTVVWWHHSGCGGLTLQTKQTKVWWFFGWVTCVIWSVWFWCYQHSILTNNLICKLFVKLNFIMGCTGWKRLLCTGIPARSYNKLTPIATPNNYLIKWKWCHIHKIYNALLNWVRVV